MPDSSEVYRYWAFLSYSSKDAAVAKKLHKRLERYRIPRDLQGRPGRDMPVPKSLFPIFRDREELPLSSELGTTIEDALRASRYLLVLCSPHAAHSHWVNEEIRYFKSLGRDDRIQAIILDGEPNASDNPATADRECFPRALRYRVSAAGELTDVRTEPIAGDLRKGGDGWTGATLKAIAGITGLGYDAFARRELRRMQRRRALIGCAAAVVLAAALWTWDYNRVKTADFASVESADGMPVGVGPLNATDRARREASYQFVFQRRKIRRVLRLNSNGDLVGDPESDDVSTQEVSYRENGSLQQIDRRNRAGTLVVRNTYSEPSQTPQGRVRYVEFKQEYQDAPLALPASPNAVEGAQSGPLQRSDIIAQRVLYDERGRIREIGYLNAYRQPLADATGVFGERFTYADGPMPARIENLGFDGMPHPDRNGLLAAAYSYNALGEIVKIEYLGADGKPLLSALGFARVDIARDGVGNETGQAYFGVDGQPVINLDGCARYTRTFDGHGHSTSREYLGARGEPVYGKKAGAHRITNRYDNRGHFIEAAYFGVDGKPVFSNMGYHRITQKVDDSSNITQWDYFGPDGEPAFSQEGFARVVQSDDKQGRPVQTSYFGQGGKPVIIKAGYATVKQSYDERGNLIEQAAFNGDGKPMLVSGEGYQRIRQTFDARGNLVEIAYLAIDGSDGFVKDGVYARIRQEFDEHGQMISNSFFSNGKPTPNYTLGYHRSTAKYDERGNLVEQSYFDGDGKPRKQGFYRRVQEFDERGNALAVEVFDGDGKPATIQGGAHRQTQKFDTRNRVTETSFFGTAGKPVTGAPGYHKMSLVYDDRGHITEELYFGPGGQSVSIAKGYHRVARVYDARGQLTEEAYFGNDGRAVLGRDGMHRTKLTYDGRGNVIEEASFDGNDQPIAINGFFRIARVFDPRGYEIERSHWGVDGKPVSNPDGYHLAKEKYDARGNKVEEAYFGNADEPILQRRGYHREQTTYDALNSVSSHAYFDLDSKLTVSSEGSRLSAGLFDSCDFLLGKESTVIIVVPAHVPMGPLFVYVTETRVAFASGANGQDVFADVPYMGAEVYRRLLSDSQVGLVEYPPGEKFPSVITAVATIRKGSPPGLRR